MDVVVLSIARKPAASRSTVTADAMSIAPAAVNSYLFALELKGVDGGDRKRGMGGETRREEKSSRIGVHHADAVAWGPV